MLLGLCAEGLLDAYRQTGDGNLTSDPRYVDSFVAKIGGFEFALVGKSFVLKA
jgi:hypothetical protein